MNALIKQIVNTAIEEMGSSYDPVLDAFMGANPKASSPLRINYDTLTYDHGQCLTDILQSRSIITVLKALGFSTIEEEHSDNLVYYDRYAYKELPYQVVIVYAYLYKYPHAIDSKITFRQLLLDMHSTNQSNFLDKAPGERSLDSGVTND